MEPEYIKLNSKELSLSNKKLEKCQTLNVLLNDDLIVLQDEKEEVIRQLKMKEIESIDNQMKIQNLQKKVAQQKDEIIKNKEYQFRVIVLEEKYQKERDFYD